MLSDLGLLHLHSVKRRLYEVKGKYTQSNIAVSIKSLSTQIFQRKPPYDSEVIITFRVSVGSIMLYKLCANRLNFFHDS